MGAGVEWHEAVGYDNGIVFFQASGNILEVENSADGSIIGETQKIYV